MGWGTQADAKSLKIRKEIVTLRVRTVPSLEGKDDLRLNLSLWGSSSISGLIIFLDFVIFTLLKFIPVHWAIHLLLIIVCVCVCSTSHFKSVKEELDHVNYIALLIQRVQQNCPEIAILKAHFCSPGNHHRTWIYSILLLVFKSHLCDNPVDPITWIFLSKYVFDFIHG